MNNDINHKDEKIITLENKIKQQQQIKQEKTKVITKKNRKIKQLKDTISEIEEEKDNLKYQSELVESLTILIVEYEMKENPPKVKRNKFKVNDLPYDEKHPNWNTKDSTILYEFNSVLHDKNKIENLIIKCNWTLKNSNKHKIYTRNIKNGVPQTLITASTPSST